MNALSTIVSTEVLEKTTVLAIPVRVQVRIEELTVKICMTNFESNPGMVVVYQTKIRSETRVIDTCNRYMQSMQLLDSVSLTDSLLFRPKNGLFWQ